MMATPAIADAVIGVALYGVLYGLRAASLRIATELGVEGDWQHAWGLLRGSALGRRTEAAFSSRGAQDDLLADLERRLQAL